MPPLDLVWVVVNVELELLEFAGVVVVELLRVPGAGTWSVVDEAIPSAALGAATWLAWFACLADFVMLKFVTMCDIDAGLSVLVRVATEAVEDQEDKVEKDEFLTILDMFELV